MGDRLSKPLLIEAICEFKLPLEQWNDALPEALYERVRSEFSQRGAMTTEVVVDLDQRIFSERPRFQFRRADDAALVQVGPGLFAVNHLRPYENWGSFRGMIERAARAFFDVVGSTAIERVGLRYINEINPQGGRVRDFLAVHPRLIGPLERPMRGLFQRYDLDYPDVGSLVHHVGLGGDPKTPSLYLDLDFGSVTRFRSSATDEVLAWLDVAHERVGEAFVASLTTDYYNSLK